MKIINEAKGSVSKIWGRQKKIEGKTYRLMDYVLKSKCEEGPLLFNVVTSEMVLIDEPIELESLFPGVYQPAMDGLIEKHFAVPEEFDEKKSVEQLRKITRKLNRHKYITGYTIYPTTCCNARCFYCFESNFHKETMTEEIADGVIDYISKHSGGNQIDITWFGGEPLVGKHIIDYISNKLVEKKIPYSSTMVSNAYLFDEAVIKTAVDFWKLRSVQITLDGTEEEYNLVKAYHNVTGSPYQRVLQNIDMLLDAGISVAVRLNITHRNADDLLCLVEELKDRFGGKKGFQVYSHLIYDQVGYDSFTYTAETKDALYDNSEIIQDKLVELGLSYGYSRLPEFKYIHCMADNDNCVTVFPNGFIGKCENSSAEDAIGNIYGDSFPERSYQYEEYKSYHMCDHCPLYPYCLHLTVCPEEGRCNEKMALRKIEKYTELLEKKYKLSIKKIEEYEEEIPSWHCGEES